MARKANNNGPKSTKKISGMTYSQHSCSKTNGGAKKLAKQLRKQGSLARVVTSGKLFCVYTRPKGARGKTKKSSSK